MISELISNFLPKPPAAPAPAAPGQAPTAATPKLGGDDGSVGLFDGVLMKAVMGGSMGIGIGMLPFIPGGPILGGVIGAVAGAGIGIFLNYRKISQIRQQ